jgi:acetyl esterase/lipase
VSHLAEYCFSAPKESLSVLPGAALLNLRFLSRDPLKTEPWVSLMRENTPSDLPLDVPSFVAQGDADPLVREDITRAFIDGLCEAGNIVEYRVYPGLGHVPAGPESAPDVLQWFAAMLRGDSPIDSCSNLRGD